MRYFNQTVNWANFFLTANDSNHQVFIWQKGELFELKPLKNLQSPAFKTKNNDNLENVLIYEYPWQLGQKMWYIPRLPLTNLDKTNSSLEFLRDFLREIIKQAKLKNITFIKFELDFGEILEKDLEYFWQNENGSEIPNHEQNPVLEIEKAAIKIIQEVVNQNNFNSGGKIIIQKSDKKFQYLETLLLNLDDLQTLKNFEKNTETKDMDNFGAKLENEQNQSKTLTNEEVKAFWLANESIWAKLMDKRTRYGTRKSLDFGWQISYEKTPENFEIFYDFALQTATRQNFSNHSKAYLQRLFEEHFSQIIILFDKENNPQAGWLGIWQDQNLVNLYGGNSLVSRDNYGQYALHLAAIFLAKSLANLKKDNENSASCFYDLGGLESGKGFDLFKKGYLGQTKKFLGPFDIIIQPKKYKIIDQLIKFSKQLKTLFRR